jgi:hypothetical protein
MIADNAQVQDVLMTSVGTFVFLGLLAIGIYYFVTVFLNEDQRIM